MGIPLGGLPNLGILIPRRLDAHRASTLAVVPIPLTTYLTTYQRSYPHTSFTLHLGTPFTILRPLEPEGTSSPCLARYCCALSLRTKVGVRLRVRVRVTVRVRAKVGVRGRISC